MHLFQFGPYSIWTSRKYTTFIIDLIPFKQYIQFSWFFEDRTLQQTALRQNLETEN